MIGKLKGLVDGYGDDHVHIDVGGVVYEAFCSSKTMQALPAADFKGADEADALAIAICHAHHRGMAALRASA